MVTHSSILAWEIPWIEEPGRLQSMGLQRVGHNLATEQQQQRCSNRSTSKTQGQISQGAAHTAHGEKQVPEKSSPQNRQTDS